MTPTIFKYPLRTIDFQNVAMPTGARILCCQNQHGDITLWAEVDADAKHEMRTFAVVGTGNPMPTNVGLRYIGSVQQLPFMWHVYEVQR